MEKKTYERYLAVLHRELVSAMGCTEPIAVSLTAAHAARVFCGTLEGVRVRASANILKNIKSVLVPNTDGARGISAAVLAGVVSRAPERRLEVLEALGDEQRKTLRVLLETVPVEVSEAEGDLVLDIEVELYGGGHTARARTAQNHLGLCLVERDGEVLFSEEIAPAPSGDSPDALSIEGILEFADAAEIADVRETLERQIEYNTAIAREGLTGRWGAAVGRTLLDAYGDAVHNRARAYAAAGSDARMNGCNLPVIINSGSGNQGLCASLPVIVYAEELGASRSRLYRALLVSNLVAIHLKSGIGCLSAYCGAISAGCGAGAGVTYLCGGGVREVSHTIVNALAINSGVVCDGAKSSCAAKIASAVEAGLMGMEMYRHGKEFYRGEGIVAAGVEATIRNVAQLASCGMAQTDREIIRIMLREE